MVKSTEKNIEIFKQQLKKMKAQNSTQFNNILNYDGDNLLITNSISAIRIKDAIKPPMIDNDTEGDYPNDPLNRQFDSDFGYQAMVYHTEDLKKALGIFKGGVNLKFIDGEIIITPSECDEVVKEIKIKNEIEGKEFEFNVNAKLLHEALMFFNKLGIESVALHHMDNPLRPIKLQGLIEFDTVEYIICPIWVRK